MIKTVAYRAGTDTRTDKKVKTEEPKILSNDIFYFKTVNIGGPIDRKDILLSATKNVVFNIGHTSVFVTHRYKWTCQGSTCPTNLPEETGDHSTYVIEHTLK